MAKKILTKKKAAWVKQFKPKRAIKGTPLNYNYALQLQYETAIKRLVRQMTEQTKRELIAFFKTETAEKFFATDASVGSGANKVTNQLTKKFQQLFNSRSKGLAEHMVSQADKASTAALHGSLKQLSGGLSLKTSVVTGDMKSVMTASIAENVGLIKSIPSQYLQKVQGSVMRSITTGNGLADLVPALDKFADEAFNRAKNIALDQTRKAYNSLNAGRMKKLGVTQYEWLHSGGGQHAREYHLYVLNGNIYSLDEPPIIDPKTGVRGKPGDLPNCKCRMRPVVSFDESPEEGAS